jgi:glutathione synthase/RimK-type ligase-like ATP-grasp enzyme
VILLCGIPSEPPVAMVSAALDELGVPALLFNQRHFAQTDLSFEVREGETLGMLTVAGRALDLREISGAYVRLMDEHALPEYQALSPEDASGRERCHRLHADLVQWLEIADARVVNRCGPMGSNSSKPFQAQLIAKSGLATPEVLITDDPELVRAFHARHGRVIYKSMSGVRSIVQELTSADFGRLERLRFCPAQFQAYVDGTNVRVHVVGGEVFATRIESDIVDYRYASRQGAEAELSAIQLDDALAERCARLASTSR